MNDGRSDLNDQLHESLRLLYGEHTNQARHHDIMRERSTAVIVTLAVAVAASIVAYLEWIDTSWIALTLSLSIVAAGCFGMLLSRLHSQSNRQHVQIARAYRMMLQKVSEPESQKACPTRTDPRVLDAIRAIADDMPKRRRTWARRDLLGSNLGERLAKLQSSSHRGAPPWTTQWYRALRDDLDKSLPAMAPHDFRAIRDFGHARHVLKWFEGEQSFWSRQIAKSWMWIHFAVMGLGILLSLLIVLRNVG